MAFTLSYNIKFNDQFSAVSTRVNAAISDINKAVDKVNKSNLTFQKRMGNIAKVTTPATAAIGKQKREMAELDHRTKAVSFESNTLTRNMKRQGFAVSSLNHLLIKNAAATSLSKQKTKEMNRTISENKRAIAGRNRKLRETIALTKTVGSGMSRFGSFVNTRVTLPLIVAGGASAKFAMDFNKSMASVATLIPKQTEKLQGYKKEVLDMSVTYGKSAGIISAGLYQVISNVGDTADTMKILDIANKAAVAGVAETADAVNLLTGISSDYGNTSAEMVQRLSDLAFKTVELGSTTFPELAMQMGKTTTLASTLGVEVDELFGSYAGLTSGTVRTSMVSTRLAGVMRALLNGTGDLGDTFDKLGVKSGKGLIQKFGGLQQALFAIKNEVGGNEIAFSKLFVDQEAKLAALALTGAKSKEAAREIALMKDVTGASSIAFDEQAKGVNAVGFKFEQSKAQIAAMSITIGDKLLPQVSILLDKSQPMIDWLASVDSESIDAAVQVAILAAKIGIAAKVLGTIISMKAGIASLTGQFTGAGGLTTAIGGTTTKALGLKKQLLSINGALGVMSSFGAGYAIGEFIHHTWMQPAEDSMTERNAEIGNIRAKTSMSSELAGMSTEDVVAMRNRASTLMDQLPKTDFQAVIESPSSFIQTFVAAFDDSVERPFAEVQENFEKAARSFGVLQAELNSRERRDVDGPAPKQIGDEKIELIVKTESGTEAEVKYKKKSGRSSVRLGSNI